MKHSRLRGEVAGAARRMGAAGLSPGTSGNVSARTPDGDVLITPSGLGYEALEAGDIALVSVEGAILDARHEPSSEVPMHTGIYRSKPGAGAVVHTHAPYSTALACLGMGIPPIHYLLAALSEEGRIPVAPYAPYGSEELARFVSEALGEVHSACLLQSHGAIAVGGDVAEAYAFAAMLESVAGIHHRAMSVGEPILLSQEQISEARPRLLAYARLGR